MPHLFLSPIRLLLAGLLLLPYGWFGLAAKGLVIPEVTRNRALLDDRGLFLDGSGLLAGPLPPGWLAAARESRRFHMVVTATADTGAAAGPARLLTLARDAGAANLMLGQDGPDLVLRFRRGDDAMGRPAMMVRDVFRPGRPTRLRLVFDAGALSLEVDDVRRLDERVARDSLDRWTPGLPLALGNVPDGNRPWTGHIARADLVTGAWRVNALAPGALERPAWLLPPPGHDFARRTDRLVNLLGFLPLGLGLGLLAGRRRPWVWAAAAAGMAGLSLGIEIAQLWLPARTPALADWILNSAGGVAGLALARLVPDTRPPDTCLPDTRPPDTRPGLICRRVCGNNLHEGVGNRRGKGVAGTMTGNRPAAGNRPAHPAAGAGRR